MSGGYIPNVIPGFSSRTFSRCSLAKNMYAERPRLGALGSSHEVSNKTHCIGVEVESRKQDGLACVPRELVACVWNRGVFLAARNLPFFPLLVFSTLPPRLVAALGILKD